MGISISYLAELISYDTAVAVIVASIVLLVFVLSDYYYNNENKERDEKLFKQPPLADDCPICFLRMPYLDTGQRYKSCCGKLICSGCTVAVRKRDNAIKCPFCRTPTPYKKEEILEREKKRMEAGDAIAIHNIGYYYAGGLNGFPQNWGKALELFHRAAELGYTRSYGAIGTLYKNGNGVKVDKKKKAKYYYELAAIGGCAQSRYNLGYNERHKGNWKRAIKHYMIAVRSGEPESLKDIKQMYSNGNATKEDYTRALRSHQAYLEEIKSVQRDEAAAYDEEYQCY